MNSKIAVDKTGSGTEGWTEASEAAAIDEIREEEYRILLIDDNVSFRRAFSFMLERKFNAQVEDVGSPTSGIDKVKGGSSYDVIFIDLIMPEMTGVETYCELRKIDPQMRLVIMSAYSNSEEWRKAQELIDVVLIHKPIPVETLIKILGGRKGE